MKSKPPAKPTPARAEEEPQITQMAQIGMIKEDHVLAPVTRAIIGAAMEVLNELGPGLDEKIYERALVLELQARGHGVEQQRAYPVLYKGDEIGRLIPDMVVDESIIVDAKVADSFIEQHIAQVLGYLAISKLEVGLLLNFKHQKLQIKRVIRSESALSAKSVVN